MWCAVMRAGLLTFLLGSWVDVSEPATESARDSAYVSSGVAWEVPCFLLIRLGTVLALAFPPLGCRLVAAAVGGVASSVREFATASRIAAVRSTLAFLALALSWGAADGTARVISVAASSWSAASVSAAASRSRLRWADRSAFAATLFGDGGSFVGVLGLIPNPARRLAAPGVAGDVIESVSALLWTF